MWFWDGSECGGSSFDDAVALADERPDGVLVRMLYRPDGRREIQQGMDWYFVAPHPSGDPVYGTSMDEPGEITERYPGAVIQRGKWAPDAFYRRVCDEAFASGPPV